MKLFTLTTTTALVSAVLCMAGATLTAEEDPPPSTSTSLGGYSRKSNSWGGAFLNGRGYSSVTGTVKAPVIPPDADPNSAAAAWVGINMVHDCNDYFVKAGFAWYGTNKRQNGRPYKAMYQWLPGNSSLGMPGLGEKRKIDFPDLIINQGDEIRMRATVISRSSGQIIMENLTTGQNVSVFYPEQDTHHYMHTFWDDNLMHPCWLDADWILEALWDDDYDAQTSPADLYPPLPPVPLPPGEKFPPLADIGTLKFTDCAATKHTRVVDDLPSWNAHIQDVEAMDGGAIMTHCSAEKDTVSCEWV